MNEQTLIYTLWILLATYIILIWRINKLIVTLETLKTVFKDIHGFFAKTKDNSTNITQLLDSIVKGEIEIDSEKYGKLKIKRSKHG